NTGLNGYPQIVTNGNNVYVVWHDATNGISFTRSVDNGASFEKARNLGNNTTSNGHPQIMSHGTNVYVAWINNSPDHHGQMVFTRSVNNGESFEVPHILHEVANEGLNGTILQPRIASDIKDKNIFLIWQSGRIVEHGRVRALISDVFFTSSSNNGASFGEIVNLSNYSGIAVDPQIAVSQNNNVYVIWTNNLQEKYGQTYLRMSTNNGASFGEIVNLSNYSGIAVDPQIAVSQNNNVYVIWTNNLQEKYGQTYLRMSTNNGASFGEIVNLSNYSGIAVDPQIAVSQNNNVYVIWTNNSTHNEVFFKR